MDLGVEAGIKICETERRWQRTSHDKLTKRALNQNGMTERKTQADMEI